MKEKSNFVLEYWNLLEVVNLLVLISIFKNICINYYKAQLPRVFLFSPNSLSCQLDDHNNADVAQSTLAVYSFI